MGTATPPKPARISFLRSIGLTAELATIKLRTQKIEERYRRKDCGGRRVNLDPGYLDSFNVVLASTKNASQRVHICC